MVKLTKVTRKTKYTSWILTVPVDVIKKHKLKGGEEFACGVNKNKDIVFERI